MLKKNTTAATIIKYYRHVFNAALQNNKGDEKKLPHTPAPAHTQDVQHVVTSMIKYAIIQLRHINKNTIINYSTVHLNLGLFRTFLSIVQFLHECLPFSISHLLHPPLHRLTQLLAAYVWFVDHDLLIIYFWGDFWITYPLLYLFNFPLSHRLG